MADFGSVKTIIDNIREAHDILRLFKNIFLLSGEVLDVLGRYQTDLDFKAEADHLYTPVQLQEINDMIQDVQTLREHWSTNHSDALNDYLPPAGGIP